MELLFPSDEAVRQMNDEYGRLLGGGTGASVLSREASSPPAGGCPVLLVLYFGFILGYNCGCGNKAHDDDGNMGRFQSRQGRDGDFHNFRFRKW